MPKTPRKYLSYSQLICWETDKEEYRQRYFYGKKRTNEAMELGKDFAEMLEKGARTALEEMMSMVLSYPQKEFTIETELDGIPLLGRLDGFDPVKNAIGEVKTGERKWTQKIVDKHDQLDFYALLVWLKFKVLPSEIKLFWCPTRRVEKLELTGEIIPFVTKRELKHLLLLMPRIKRAWAGIQEMAEEEYSVIK